MNFNSARVLITGASAGIGEAFAREFYARGANLILLARRQDRLEILAKELRQSPVGKIEIIVADLTKSTDLAEVCNFIKSEHIDILVNNAGRGSFGSFSSLNLAGEQAIVKLNVNATVELTHAVLAQMVKRRSGHIISLASIVSFVPLPYMATYAASKAFNFFHSLALRYELKKFGVNVLTVCPGPTATEFGDVAAVPSSMKKPFRDSSTQVAQMGIAALERGQAFVITGWRSYFLALFSRILPYWISVPMGGIVLRKSVHEKEDSL